MDQSRRSYFEDEKHEQQKKSSTFDLEEDYSFQSINNDHRTASDGEKNNTIEEGNLLKAPGKQEC